MKKALGPEHANVAASLNNLAELYRAQGRYADAEPLSNRALAISEKALGPDHPSVATSLNNLAGLYKDQGRYADAEPLDKRSLGIREKARGPEHPNVGQSLNNLAELYRSQGRYADAEPLYKRSLGIWEKALGADHPNVALSLNNLAALYGAQGRFAEALVSIRGASAILRDRVERSGAALSPGAHKEQQSLRFVFLRHVQAALDTFGEVETENAALTAEAFEAVQLAQATSTAAAVASMGARFAAGDDSLARLVRARQDAVDAWRALDKTLVERASRPPDQHDAEAEADTRARLAEIGRNIEDLDARLAKEFPDYAELSAARPVPLPEVRALLAADEALLAWAPWDDRTYLWVVRKDGAEMHSLEIGADALADAVSELRAGLDPFSVETLKFKKFPRFDTTRAYELYSKMFAPTEPLLEGAAHVFVVPDGALQSLPLGVLVTGKPEGAFTDFSGYRQVPWLARRYALTVLPSVSSLRALRQFAKATKAEKPFIGVGDPLLEGHPGRDRRVALAALFTPRGVADVDAVRSMPALPETAAELKALARALGADEGSLYLREAATETRIKAADLASARVLAFATHGLVAGDFKGLAEPALVLTPPETGTEGDDGLLTASEVALLKLDADLVILSACNTAAADGTPGADALSGLAKAFFYAGARSLLVSHWPVLSDAAVNLTTRMLSEAAEHPDIGRAEALRRSMLALIEDRDHPHYAHPMFWAPFVVVGEGGRPRAAN